VVTTGQAPTKHPSTSKVSEGDGLLPDQHLHFFQHPLQELDANLEFNLTSDDIQTSEGAPETEDHTEEDQPINEQLQTLKLISIKKVASEHQLADILTKPLAQELFIRLCDAITNNTTTATNQADEGV
jgi:hypothetical protein